MERRELLYLTMIFMSWIVVFSFAAVGLYIAWEANAASDRCSRACNEMCDLKNMWGNLSDRLDAAGNPITPLNEVNNLVLNISYSNITSKR